MLFGLGSAVLFKVDWHKIFVLQNCGWNNIIKMTWNCLKELKAQFSTFCHFKSDFYGNISKSCTFQVQWSSCCELYKSEFFFFHCALTWCAPYKFCGLCSTMTTIFSMPVQLWWCAHWYGAHCESRYKFVKTGFSSLSYFILVEFWHVFAHA